MLKSILNQDLCKTIRQQIAIKEKQFNCLITLYMSNNSNDGCEMQVVYLNPASLGVRKKISLTTNSAEVAAGIIKYFKEEN